MIAQHGEVSGIVERNWDLMRSRVVPVSARPRRTVSTRGRLNY